MKKQLGRIISIILVLSLLPILSGCKKKMNVIQYDSGAYSSSKFEIPQRDGYEAWLASVLKDAENTCISVVYSQYDKEGMLTDQYTDVFTVNDEGKILRTLELLGDQPPCVVLEEEYAFLGYNKVDLANNGGDPTDQQLTAVFLDKKTGDFIRTIVPDFHPYYISETSDGFVIVGASAIAKYTKNGELISSIDLGFSCYIEAGGFFEDNGKYYIIEENELCELIYHEVNFETGACPAIASSEDIGIHGMNEVSGQYYFNPDGEYRLDLSNMQTECIADWNCIDIQPPLKTLYTPSKKYGIDDERFAISYVYRDLSAEVLLFHYDPTIDRSQIETIRIGGYGVYDDLVLQWAVYNFNVSNKQYRAVLEDYGLRFEGYTPEELRKAKLNLTQYFNEGNTPDIYYGTRFDYEYMGRNGMVIDLEKYVSALNKDSSTLTQAAYGLMYNGEGACYQFFSGFVTYGYYTQKSVVDAIEDTSIFSLYQYAQDHDIPYTKLGSADVVDVGIRYDFANLFGAYDGQQKITHEELEQLVSIVVTLPSARSGMASEDDVRDGVVLMCSEIGSSYIAPSELGKEPLQYIGYPSFHDSIYLAVPQSCMAISSTAKNPDACWEVLATLLSEDAQKQTLVSGNIPVTQAMLDTLCDMAMNPQKIQDEVLKGCVLYKDGVSQEDVDRFLQNVAKVDTVATYDWGIFNIISEEIDSYYTQNRTPNQITDSLEERLVLYMQENYQ